MKVFLDANILFSASDAGSATRQLLDRVLEVSEAVTSPHAWEEAKRNLEQKRPQHLPGLIALQRVVAVTHAFRLPPDISLPDKDRPILAGAIGSSCSHLWTSDRLHFGSLYGRAIHGVKVVSSVQLADELG